MTDESPAAITPAARPEATGVASFTYRRQVTIEWGQCDPAGIVFNSRFFEIFDTNTWKLFEAALGVKPRELAGTFGIIGSLTQGGPGQATNILVWKVYNDGFRGQDLGGSSAQSVVLMLVVILLTFVQFRFIERRVHY